LEVLIFQAEMRWEAERRSIRTRELGEEIAFNYKRIVYQAMNYEWKAFLNGSV